MSIIVHIARKGEWEQVRDSGSYVTATFAAEGFIHCSLPGQVVPVANVLFKAQKDLVLLIIDSAKVDVEIKYENLEGGTELFPHVCGALPAQAVVTVLDFPPQDDGTFVLPGSLKP
jgi:uncharacterized protein (DUF952 family)